MYQGHFTSDNDSRKAPRKRRWFIPLIAALLGVILVLLSFDTLFSRRDLPPSMDNPPVQTSPDVTELTEVPTETGTEPLKIPEAITAFAQENNIDVSAYPKSIIKLFQKNAEASEFALNYPLEYGKEHAVNMDEYEDSESMPLFLQWDKRWGYLDYDGDVAGLSACGPLCLSMVGYYLTGDEERFRPDNVISFAIDNGYCVPGNGSSWTLISEGGEELGLDVTEIPLDIDRITENLEVGNPIICIMGPGVFTTSGHFIVLTQMENGKFRVNDPNSRTNSEKLWSFDEFDDQILNLWVLR